MMIQQEEIKKAVYLKSEFWLKEVTTGGQDYFNVNGVAKKVFWLVLNKIKKK